MDVGRVQQGWKSLDFRREVLVQMQMYIIREPRES